jgi:lipoate-protein ligase A
MSMFAALNVYCDGAAHSAAMNMAIDETLLEYAAVPSIRFYRWHSPALSFGYFGKFAHVSCYAAERDLVRRWTGGGIVFHGDDLTYSIVIPANDTAFSESSIAIYEKVHRALCDALDGNGKRAVVAGGGDPGSAADARQAILVPHLQDERRYSEKGDLPWQIAGRRTGDRRFLASDCFANPVRADVMVDGRKIAGAAQRRTRRGLLQQGSIQGVDLENGLSERFAVQLSTNCETLSWPKAVQCRAREIVAQKYGAETWLRKR